MLDALRFMGAIAVIWQHSANSTASVPWHGLGTWGVPFFAAAAMFFLFEGVRRNPMRPFGSYALARVRRIYVPFAIWSVLYLLFRWTKHLVVDPQRTPRIVPSMFISGTAHHLWFLPFLMLVSICASPIAKWTVAARWRCLPVATICIIAGACIAYLPLMPSVINPNAAQITDIAAIASAPEPPASAFPPWVWHLARSPFGYLANRTWYALPAVLWGTALGALAGVIGKFMRSNALFGAAAAVLFVLAIAMEIRGLLPPRLADNFAGALLVIVGLMPWTGQIIRALAKQGAAAYAIYLVHLAYLEAIMTILQKEMHMTEGMSMDLEVFALSTIISLFIGQWIANSRLSPWLAPS
jgi:fucose 4-O-acetylase-like acetyltransferase